MTLHWPVHRASRLISMCSEDLRNNLANDGRRRTLAGELRIQSINFGRTAGMKKSKKNTARGRKTSSKPSHGMVDFDYANTSYQIDPTRRKVYHRWIEVETARTCLIMGA